MSRKKVIITTIILILILIIIGKTLAYMTDKKEIGDTFTDGKVSISLRSPSTNFEETGKMEIGETISNDPTITNIGNIDSYAFISVSVEKLYYKSDDDEKKEIFKYQINDGWIEISQQKYDSINVHLYAYVDSNGKMKKIKPNESTTPLFNNLTFIPSEYYGTELYNKKYGFDFYTYGYGIQTVGVSDDPLETWKSIKTNETDETLGSKELEEKYNKNKNTFTLGNAEITLTEPNSSDSAESSTWYHNSDDDEGYCYTKDPTINVTGQNNTYIFMRVDVPSDGFNEIYKYEIENGWKEITTTKSTKYSNYKTHIYAYVDNGNKLNAVTSGTKATLFTKIKSLYNYSFEIYVKSEVPTYGYAIETSQATTDPIETFKKFVEKYKNSDKQLIDLEFKEE